MVPEPFPPPGRGRPARAASGPGTRRATPQCGSSPAQSRVFRRIGPIRQLSGAGGTTDPDRNFSWRRRLVLGLTLLVASSPVRRHRLEREAVGTTSGSPTSRQDRGRRAAGGRPRTEIAIRQTKIRDLKAQVGDVSTRLDQLEPELALHSSELDRISSTSCRPSGSLPAAQYDRRRAAQQAADRDLQPSSRRPRRAHLSASGFSTSSTSSSTRRDRLAGPSIARGRAARMRRRRRAATPDARGRSPRRRAIAARTSRCGASATSSSQPSELAAPAAQARELGDVREDGSSTRSRRGLQRAQLAPMPSRRSAGGSRRRGRDARPSASGRSGRSRGVGDERLRLALGPDARGDRHRRRRTGRRSSPPRRDRDPRGLDGRLRQPGRHRPRRRASRPRTRTSRASPRRRPSVGQGQTPRLHGLHRPTASARNGAASEVRVNGASPVDPRGRAVAAPGERHLPRATTRRSGRSRQRSSQVEAVADEELVRDGEADVAQREVVDEAAVGAVEQRHGRALRGLRARASAEVVQRQAGVDDVLDDEDVATAIGGRDP